jgi:hypothetical protein
LQFDSSAKRGSARTIAGWNKRGCKIALFSYKFTRRGVKNAIRCNLT